MARAVPAPFNANRTCEENCSGIGNDCEGEHGDGDDDTIKKYLLTGEELDDDEQTQG